MFGGERSYHVSKKIRKRMGFEFFIFQVRFKVKKKRRQWCNGSKKWLLKKENENYKLEMNCLKIIFYETFDAMFKAKVKNLRVEDICLKRSDATSFVFG
jgi:hypothetical protein